MMLTTPAMASVPYWAAAPSCSTSMRSMADTGNEVEIRRRATLIGPAEHGEVAGGMTPLAVDEHERVIRAQAAQACGQRERSRCRRRTPAR